MFLLLPLPPALTLSEYSLNKAIVLGEFLLCFVFLLHHRACGILVPCLGVEPVPLALEAREGPY